MLSVEAVRLSFELAASAYDMGVESWLDAGWTDVSIQVDNHLRSGITKASLRQTKQYLKNTWFIYKSKWDLIQLNPVSQLRSAMRQRRQSDTGKALIMIHPSPQPGRFVVAIGFMGTGRRFYDWFSNFRMTSDGGFHKGFLQLARQLEENEPFILFPQTAQALGLEKLSLRDILEECRRPDSRFDIWMAGHSQGGAVMQMWTYLKIQEDGVLPARLTGYGFASPTVAGSTVLPDPAAYPLYHILNSDDYVPRVGARVHLGVGLVYPSGDALRKACYGWAQTPQAVHHRALMRRLTRRIVDAPTCIESGLAYLELIMEQPHEKVEEELSSLQGKFSAMKRLLEAADKRQGDLLRFIRRHAMSAYESMTGHPIDMALITGLKIEMEAVAREISIPEMNKALQELMIWPHALTGKGGRPGTYSYIVLTGVQELHPFIWQSGEPPMRLWLEAVQEAALEEAGRIPLEQGAQPLRNKRLSPAHRRPMPRRHQGYSSRRRRSS